MLLYERGLEVRVMAIPPDQIEVVGYQPIRSSLPEPRIPQEDRYGRERLANSIGNRVRKASCVSQ